MGLPAATADSTVVGVDLHTVVVPSGPPVLLPHPYAGRLTTDLIPSVLIEGKPAAVQGSGSQLDTAHVPTPPGTSFVAPPDGRGIVGAGSPTVLIGGKSASRAGDPVTTCSEAAQPAAVIQTTSTVLVG
jgi:uncharacterized Zn-binding protein involved in type VI secretion